MHFPRHPGRSGLVALAVSLALFAPAAAGARNVTVGSPMIGPFEKTTSCEPPSCTVANTGFSAPGALATSPVDGAIVRWRMLGGAPGTDYRLRVLEPAGGARYNGAGTGTAQSPTDTALQSFPAALPIRAGQGIGLDIGDAAGTIAFRQEPGLASFLTWVPVLGDDNAVEGIGNGEEELAFNAEVQPTPTVAGFSPASGSFKGGERVTIEGTDLTGTESVLFGTTHAKSFTVDSEERLTAILPTLAAKSISPVSVRTAAGTASAQTAFTATACVVPRLVGKTLRKAKRRLRRAACEPGTLRGRRSAGARVRKQSPGPGTPLVPGGRVRLILG